MHTSSLLFLVGGGRSPRYPPNKVILWDDALGEEVAELEFRERVRGLACRKGWLAVALRRRVVVYELATAVSRYGEWDTCDNPRGAYDRHMHPYRSSSINFTYSVTSPQSIISCMHPPRSACDGYRYIFYTTCDTRPPNGACTSHPSPPVCTTRTIRSTIFGTLETTHTTGETSRIDVHCARERPHHTHHSVVWESRRDKLFPRNTYSHMGLYHGQTCAGIPQRHRQGRDLRCGFPS